MLNNGILSFNHSDIDRVEFLGYISDEYNKLNMRLTQNVEKYCKDKEVKNNINYNFKFDENGVVIFDPMVDYNYENYRVDEKIENSKEDIFNPFRDRYESALNKDSNVNSDEWPIFPENKIEE